MYAHAYITINQHGSSPDSSQFDEHMTSTDRKNILNLSGYSCARKLNSGLKRFRKTILDVQGNREIIAVEDTRRDWLTQPSKRKTKCGKRHKMHMFM